MVDVKNPYTWASKFKNHIGHNIVCVCYQHENQSDDEFMDICLECEDCDEVLVSAETMDME